MFRRQRSRLVCYLSACLIGLGTTGGCLPQLWPPGYLPSVVVGELEFLSGMVPIEAAVDDPALTQEQRDKLAFIIRARDYAEQVIGLNAANNFHQFVNLGDETLAWNLSASRKDALEAYVWNVPVAGPIPYLGFFDFDQAMAERDRLVELGYDTMTYEIDTYALWVLPDPVSSPMLRKDYGFLADVVMHELLHNTILKPEDMTFSESLAVFVGRAAGKEFLNTEFVPDDPLIEETRRRYEDEDRFNTFLQGLVADLEELYGSELSPDEKIARREDVFQKGRERFVTDFLPLMNYPEEYEAYGEFPFNNAFLLLNVRYSSDLDVFEGIYELTGHNWPETLHLFSAAANTDKPVQFLRERLAAGR